MSDNVHLVGIGEFSIAGGEAVLMVYGLGSCMALILFDPASRRGGLAHVLLPGSAPEGGRDTDLPAKYATEAISLLMAELGPSQRLQAVIVGGARLFQADGSPERSVGARNAEFLRASLDDRGIPVACEDTGGEVGRTVRFSLPACKVEVRTLREGWKTLYEPPARG